MKKHLTSFAMIYTLTTSIAHSSYAPYPFQPYPHQPPIILVPLYPSTNTQPPYSPTPYQQEQRMLVPFNSLTLAQPLSSSCPPYQQPPRQPFYHPTFALQPQALQSKMPQRLTQHQVAQIQKFLELLLCDEPRSDDATILNFIKDNQWILLCPCIKDQQTCVALCINTHRPNLLNVLIQKYSRTQINLEQSIAKRSKKTEGTSLILSVLNGILNQPEKKEEWLALLRTLYKSHLDLFSPEDKAYVQSLIPNEAESTPQELFATATPQQQATTQPATRKNNPYANPIKIANPVEEN